jgi:hypothetical protein
MASQEKASRRIEKPSALSASYAGQTTGEPERIAPFFHATGSLEADVTDLHEALMMLRSQLAAVLEEPSEGGKDGGTFPLSSVPAVAAVQSIQRMVCSCHAIVRDISARVVV